MKPAKAQYELIIIGGGAAGYFSAINAAERLHPDAKVLILEKSSRVLGKVRISGGGRCNVTHDCHDPKRLATHYPRGAKSLIGSFHRFGAEQTIDWFTKRGVALKVEPDGRMFPTTNNSETVIDCLTQAADRAGVECATSQAVTKLQKSDDGVFVLTLKSGDTLTANKVMLATGGTRAPEGSRMAEALGHTTLPAVPSLFTFHITDPRIFELQGLSVDPVRTEIVGTKLTAEGPLLITHWGMSGPAILKLSAWGARQLSEQDYRFSLRVNWLPHQSSAPTFDQWRDQFGKRSVTTRSPFTTIPKRVWERFVAAAKIAPETTWSQLTRQQRDALIREIEAGEFTVTGKSLNKDEFVTCGGIPLKEVNLKTMESKLCDGLYFAGEILDVDGITGGFNFQHAWTTGYLAGCAIAEYQRTL